MDAQGIRPERLLEIESARRTLDYLDWLVERPQLSDGAGSLLRRVAATIRVAREKEGDLQPADVLFGCHEVNQLIDQDPDRLREEWLLLATPFILGVGSLTAPVIVMGTEAADRADDALAFLGAGRSIIDLCGGRWDVLDRLSEDVKDNSWRRLVKVGTALSLPPYHRDPVGAWCHVEGGRPSSGHTWRKVAAVVAGSAPDPLAALCQNAYQIERSVMSSLTAAAGVAPDVERRRFLCEAVLPTLRTHARVLILHGHAGYTEDPGDDAWMWTNRGVTSAFLGSWRPPEPKDVDGHPYWIFTEDGGPRMVVWCRALNGRTATTAYVRQLAEEVSSSLSASPRGEGAGPPARHPL